MAPREPIFPFESTVLTVFVCQGRRARARSPSRRAEGSAAVGPARPLGCGTDARRAADRFRSSTDGADSTPLAL